MGRQRRCHCGNPLGVKHRKQPMLLIFLWYSNIRCRNDFLAPPSYGYLDLKAILSSVPSGELNAIQSVDLEIRCICNQRHVCYGVEPIYYGST